MNSLATSHYLIATHTDSKDIFFPGNTPNDFRVKFIRPLFLTGSKWKVALLEIDFINAERFVPADTRPTHYILEFADCDGLLIKGCCSSALRLFPHTRKDHISFDEPFYFPVTRTLLDTCQINVTPYDNSGPMQFDFGDTSNIIITLHFKKF